MVEAYLVGGPAHGLKVRVPSTTCLVHVPRPGLTQESYWKRVVNGQPVFAHHSVPTDKALKLLELLMSGATMEIKAITIKGTR